MDALVIVSPHFDDAVLSCGQFMSGRPDTTVVTVFGGTPDAAHVLTDFDRRSGFESGQAAVRARRLEDRLATRLLHGDSEHLHFLDGQYRNDEADVDAIVEQLVRSIEHVGASEVVAPLGLLHPDHRAASEAALQLVGLYAVWLYEELPNRVLRPDVVAMRLVELAERFDVVHEFIGEGPMHAKARAVHAYESQQWALDRRCLFVPERFHRVTAR